MLASIWTVLALLLVSSTTVITMSWAELPPLVQLLIMLCLLTCDTVLLPETATSMPEACLRSKLLLDPLSTRPAPIQCAAMHTLGSFMHPFICPLIHHNFAPEVKYSHGFSLSELCSGSFAHHH